MNELPMSAPDITDRERELVIEVLNTPNLSGGGPMLQQLEAMCAACAGRKYAIAVSSGTAALHIIVRGLGLGPGDAVITTPYSFVASSNCLLYEGVEPVFVDIQQDTFNIDPDRIRKLLHGNAALRRRVKGILAVDVFGHPAEWDSLKAIAVEYGLRLIEDSAESLGSSYRGRPAGSFGDAGVFAFYPNKQITTGEGGAVLTDDEGLAEVCRSLRNQGRGPSSEWLEHVRLGYNYRLSEIHAALGVAQMERLDDLLAKRAQVAAGYTQRLQNVPYLSVPSRHPDVDVSWFVYVIRLKNGSHRTQVVQRLKEKGIPTRPYFPAIHLMPFYAAQFGFKPGDFPATEAVASSTLALPFHGNMDEASMDYVCDQLLSLTEELS
ncbi:MAG: DegT/DnrJ/EryC1/StrS family aminotransferase [Dehalococcoidia bacterium]|nr:DegT/DnrJ/EryC1/StrS family aminotransferase [Dehalococcoidia bacterium]